MSRVPPRPDVDSFLVLLKPAQSLTPGPQDPGLLPSSTNLRFFREEASPRR